MLLNTAVFNSRMFNGGTTLAAVYSTNRIVFEGFSLSDGSTMVLTDLEDSGPTRELIGGAVPRGDGEYLTADYFRERKLVARGYVKAASASAMATQLDLVRKSLRAREGSLDVIDDNGTVKRYLATLENYEELFSDKQRYHITICPFQASFVCKTPFGKARNYTSVFYPSMATSGTVQSIVNPGTYKAQPVFILVFSAASSVTAITLTNSSTGESINYTGSAAAGDVFIFDSEMKAVTKNGSAADFTGAFPTLTVGPNLIAVTVTGTSFSLDMTSKYRATYL